LYYRIAMSTAVSLPPIALAVREFVDRDVRPAASALEHADQYPHGLVTRMHELGLFGALVPARYGGLGLDVTTYAMVIEELCRGWMSLAGVLNSHTMAALIVLHHGTEEQRERLLPRFARGDARGGLCLTEPHAGSDVQAIRTVARRRGDDYLISGTKMFVTNGREGNTFALLALTDPAAQPRHRGMSCFIVEKEAPGLTVVKSISKLGYKGVDTAELLFEEFAVPASNLVGGVTGRGFQHVMSALETGRINIAARAVGVAQAAWDDALTQARRSPEAPSPRLADMAARLRAGRLATYWAAGMKDRAERCDLEAGMAKLFASEAAHVVATASLQLHREAGQLATSTIERHYRDTPLMIIGEGTNEIQRTIIARHLLERYGERLGALTSRESECEDRRQIVLAVRQFVEKTVVPLARASDAYPAEPLAQLADLGVLGATAAPEDGGLGLDLETCAMILEELARGSAALAGIATAHLAATHVVARHGHPRQRARMLPPLTRGDVLATLVFGVGPVTALRTGEQWCLAGRVPFVENTGHATLLLVGATADGAPSSFLVPRDTPGLALEPSGPTLAMRGLDLGDVRFDDVRVNADALVEVDGGGDRRDGPMDAAGALARLGAAAMAIGVAQAAFEAALRYSQQRSTFGKPICQHQAVQLKLADMATAITAARLLAYDGARQFDGGGDDTGIRLAKLFASEVAADATLEAMRIHGGYGYTTEFPVERYYRDAARLVVCLGGNDDERQILALRLRDAG
jgi:alkylation response protein AidB-like acyl-CoA dehydrogenase